ncbi:MAG: hypothetical protein HQL76_07875 [Magnetococcales bacterium]|nr:hypothetical protein [Magnetococcales bacterium]
MNDKPLSQAEDADVRHVMQALERTSRRAREIAFQTRTALVVVREGRLVREYPVHPDIQEEVQGP